MDKATREELRRLAIDACRNQWRSDAPESIRDALWDSQFVSTVCNYVAAIVLHSPALLDALDAAEHKLAEVVEYATAADAEREALKAEPARKVANIALARAESEEKRRIDMTKNWKSMCEERDAAVARAEKAEAALKDARRAALEEAATVCVRRRDMECGQGLDEQSRFDSVNDCVTAIRALAAKEQP